MLQQVAIISWDSTGKEHSNIVVAPRACPSFYARAEEVGKHNREFSPSLHKETAQFHHDIVFLVHTFSHNTAIVVLDPLVEQPSWGCRHMSGTIALGQPGDVRPLRGDVDIIFHSDILSCVDRHDDLQRIDRKCQR